jgi:conjugal transfer pilus assembly protein TraL
MSLSDQQLKMPTRLDAPAKFLFWDLDQALIVGTFFSLGIVSKQLITLTALGLAISWFWQKFKSGKHPWFLLHGFKWFLPLGRKSKRIPNTCEREFLR